MHDQHPRAGGVLGDDVLGEDRALLGRRPRPQGLPDRHHVVVDRLRHAHDLEFIPIFMQVCREVGCRRIGVVAADRVEDVDTVLGELLGRHVQGALALLDQPALDAVLDVGQLDPGVAERAAPEAVEQVRPGADLVIDGDRIAGQQTGITIAVADDLDLRRDGGVALDQAADGAGQTRRETTGGQHSYFADGHGRGLSREEWRSASILPPRADSAVRRPSRGRSADDQRSVQGRATISGISGGRSGGTGTLLRGASAAYPLPSTRSTSLVRRSSCCIRAPGT